MTGTRNDKGLWHDVLPIINQNNLSNKTGRMGFKDNDFYGAINK